MLVGLGGLIVIVGIGTGLTGGKHPPEASGSRAATSTASSAAAPKAEGTAGGGPGSALTYRVTGTPGAAVTYGPPGSTRTGQGPMHVTTTLGSALYYSLTAQLDGSGSVRCEILIGSTVLSRSVANGGRHLAFCEISRDPLSGLWQDADGG
jgi:hypothetical protein